MERGRREDQEARDAQVLLVESAGHLFPGTLWENQLVPEALSYRQDRLPHRRSAGERDRLFPRAVAAAEQGDVDFEKEPCAMSQRGEAVVAASQDVSKVRKEVSERGEYERNGKFGKVNEPDVQKTSKDREAASSSCKVVVPLRESYVQEGDKRRWQQGDRHVGYGVHGCQHDLVSDIFI
jgi:hypothetical protein